MSAEPPRAPVEVGAEPVKARDPARLAHLTGTRGLIVQRALLSTALGGVIPLPILDDVVATRVRAGLFMRLARGRGVDLPPASAEILAEAKGASTLRHITLTAATLVALRLAWKKLVALLAAGRGAEDMAFTFQVGTLFDHYCARVHVGGAITRSEADALRVCLHQAVSRTSRTRLEAAFREGARVLGRSFAEAPRWASRHLTAHAERWVRSGGRDEASPIVEEPAGEERAFIDRAARAVEERLSALGGDYLGSLVDGFEALWRERQAEPPAADPQSD